MQCTDPSEALQQAYTTRSLINLPFFIAGTLKIGYDLLLYGQFVAVRPPEEARP